LVLPIFAYTLSSTKLEIRQNSFFLVARGKGSKGRSNGEGEGTGEVWGRNDTNIMHI
jgi:hypothetical protein